MGTVAGAAAIAGVAASVIGTGVSVYGSMQQADAQKKAADYQAQVARNNQAVADQNARAVQQQAEVKAQADQRAGALRLGSQRAAMGASGITLDSGSALDVQDATVRNTAVGVQNDLYQGALSAYGYETQGSNFQAQAGLDTMQGEAASQAGLMNAGSSLLSGASQVASKWDAYKKATGPTSGASTATPVFGGLY